MNKKLILCCFLVIIMGAPVFSEVSNLNYFSNAVVNLQLPVYAKFYRIDSNNVTVKYTELRDCQQKQLTSNENKYYKQIKKIQKYIDKKDFRRALDIEPSFLPTHVQYMEYSLNAGDYQTALSEIQTIQRLNQTAKIFDNEKLNYKLGMLYYLSRDYTTALRILLPYQTKQNPSVENLWFALSDIYYNLGDFNQSITYAKKIQPYSQNYAGAQELLYNSYYNQQNYKAANTVAFELVRVMPSPINYMRLGTTSSDNNTKLINYYKARSLAVADKNYTALAQADTRIIPIEQAKIDKAYAGLTLFVNKPDWAKIASENEKIVSPIDLSNRMQNFFAQTNSCVAKFGGAELVKCFESVNNEQAELTKQAKEAYKQECEERQRELEYQRQQMLFRQQTYYERMYMDDFFYMRRPYFFGYW